MAIDFPNSPSNNDQYTVGTTTWKYNGTAWVIVVGEQTIATGSITTDKIATNAITASKLATSASVAFAAVTAPLVGNASTATALQTARNIAGQSFDGSANISIAPTDLTGVTSTAAEINILDGATLSTTELNYVDGVTSAIQTQIDTKAPSASPTFTGVVTLPDNTVALGTKTTGDYVSSLVAGTGVTLTNNSGETATPTVAIGQAVGTSASVTFAKVDTTGDVTVGGNLTVNGTTTTLNTETLAIEDNIVVLNSNVTGPPATNAGIEVERGTSANVSLRWNETSDKWEFTQDGSTYYDIATEDFVNAQSISLLGEIGDVSASTAVSGDFLKYNGAAWINDPINLGTDTVGNYVSDLTAGTGVTITHTPGEGSSPTVAIGQSVATSASVTFAKVNTNGLESFGGITFTPSSTLVGTVNTAAMVSNSASPVVAVPANRSIEFSDSFYYPPPFTGSVNFYRIRFNDADQFWSSFSAEVQGLFSGLPTYNYTWVAPTTPVSLLFKWRHVSVDQFTNLDANTTWITNRYTRFDNILLGDSQSFPPGFWFNLYCRSNTYTGGPNDDRVEVVAGTFGYSLSGGSIYTYNGQSATNNASSSRVYIDEVSLVYGSTVQVLVTSNQNIGNEFSGKTVFGIGANYLDVSDFTFNSASATYSPVSPVLSAGDNIYSFDESQKPLISKYFDGSVSASVGFDPIVGSFTYNGNEVLTDADVKIDDVDYQTIAIGASAMYLGLAGVAPDESIAIGYQALQGANGSSSNKNIAIGYQSINGTQYGTDIYNNTLIGWKSGRYIGTVNGGVNNNTGVGYYNLRSLTTGDYNTAIGVESLAVLSTGSYNTAVGTTYSGGGITSGSYNVAVGLEAGGSIGSGSSNTAIGTGALYSGSGGSYNVALGSYAGQYGGQRSYSTSIGHKASSHWQNASAGSYSISIGFYAAERLQTADNISIGKNAARYNQSGGQTVCIGADAMYSAAGTGTGNTTAIGFRALYEVTGSGNTAVGTNSGASMTSGTQNTIIGYEAAHATGSGTRLTTGSNNTVIGYNSLPSSSTVSNTITLGNSSITTLRCQVTSITALSDQRDKTNIATSQYGLELVNQLRPVTFDWNTRDGAKVGIKDIGFIAQELVEVEDALNAHDTLALTYRDNPEKLEASYGRLIPILVKAIQELSAEVEILKNR